MTGEWEAKIEGCVSGEFCFQWDHNFISKANGQCCQMPPPRVSKVYLAMQWMALKKYVPQFSNLQAILTCPEGPPVPNLVCKNCFECQNTVTGEALKCFNDSLTCQKIGWIGINGEKLSR